MRNALLPTLERLTRVALVATVLAVGGAAREHPMVLIFGLALSIALMGLAASLIARLLQKYRWIAYVGLVSILYVALQMIWRGWNEMEPYAEEGMRSLMVLTGGSAIGLATLLASVIGIVSFAVIRQRRRRKSAAAKTGHGDG